LYYWALWAWRFVFGSSLAAARALSILFTLATLVVLMRLTRHLRFWWAAGLIFAVYGASFQVGPLARDYALAGLLLTLTVMAASGAKSTAGAAAAGALGALTFATHYLALFPVLAILGVYFVSEWRTGRLRAGIPALTFLLFALPVVPIALHATGLRPNQHKGFAGWMMEGAYLFRGLCRQLVSQPHELGLWLGRLALGAAGLILILALFWAISRRLDRSAESLAAWAVIGQLVGMYALFAAAHKTLVSNDSAPRYLSIVAPLIPLLVAGWLSEARGRMQLAAAGAVAVFLGAELLSRDPCYETLDVIRGRIPPGATIVVGMGSDRAGPGVIALQVPSDARICVISSESSCLEELQSAPFFSPSASSSPSAAHERSFLTRCGTCRIIDTDW
jgi:hypothetical protein